MPPAKFFVRLQQGIAGGFAPPSPSAIHTLSRALDNPAVVVVNSSVRPDGTSSLSDCLTKKISVDYNTALIDELHSILKEIPTESPPGSEDIYGLDMSIAWGSQDLQWCNGGSSGCGSGRSEIPASDEDKKKFKRAVEIMNELIKQEP